MNIKNFFNKFLEKKSLNRVLSQNSSINYHQQNGSTFNSTLDSDNVWQKNPYNYLKNTLATLINGISNTISTLDYEFRNEKGDILTSNHLQEVENLLKNPSSRQQTKEQLLKDLAKEYTFNNLMFLIYDLELKELSCIKAFEIMPQNLYTDNKMYKSYIWYKGQSKVEYFNLIEDGYYVNNDNNLYLFASELVFEELGTVLGTHSIYTKNVFNEMWKYHYLEYLIINKNTLLCDGKQEANLLAVSLKNNNTTMTEDDKRAITETIKNSTRLAYNNGQTQAIFFDNPIDASLISLNNNVFNMQFKEQLDEVKRSMYAYFKIPTQSGLEQAKFTNNITGGLEYIENAVKPRADFIYNFLSRTINSIFQINISIIPIYQHTSIMKQFNADYLVKIQNFLTKNEARDLIQYEPIKGGDVLNSPTLQNNQDNQKEILEAKKFFDESNI